MAGLLESLWPYIPPGFRQAMFGGNDYGTGAPPRTGLLSALPEFSPGADIRDAVNYSGAATRALGSGNVPQALLDTAYIPAALAGVVLPGSASSYRQAGGAVSDALATPRRIDDPMRGYHASPYSFDAFDSSKINTGQGAQMYGRGHYIAENEDVARSYRQSVPYQQLVRQFRDALPDDADFTEVTALVGTGALLPYQERVIKALAADDWLGFDYPSQAISAAYRNLENYDPSQELRDAIAESGHMYEVAIHARPDEFVDWNPSLMGLEDKLRESGVAGFRYLDQGSRGATNVNDIRGSLSMWESALQKNPADEYAQQQVATLRDQLARAERGLTHNYVVFDDKLIEILRKYGLLGPMLAGGLGYGLLGGGESEPTY